MNSISQDTHMANKYGEMHNFLSNQWNANQDQNGSLFTSNWMAKIKSDNTKYGRGCWVIRGSAYWFDHWEKFEMLQFEVGCSYCQQTSNFISKYMYLRETHSRMLYSSTCL